MATLEKKKAQDLERGKVLKIMFILVVGLWVGWLPARAYEESSLSGAMLPITCPSSIPFGQLFDCALNSVAEVDTYTFTGAVNDKIFFRVLRTSGAMQPSISVLDPGNQSVCSNYTYGNQISLGCSLNTSGTFSFKIGDTSNDATGGYKVYAQRLNDSANASGVEFGQIYTAATESQIETKAFFFDAEINDQLLLRTILSTGGIQPRMYVYDKNGNEVCGSYTYGSLVSLDPCTITASGRYSILIDDVGLDNTGGFALHLQRRNNPGNATPIVYGSPLNSGLTQPAEIDAFTITAQTNDQLIVRMYKTSGSYQPRLRIYDRNGVETCSGYSYGTTVSIFPCPISTTGAHTIIVDDIAETRTGNYTLYLQRVNNPGNAIPITFGQSLNDTISAVTEFRTFTFNGANGDALKLTMTRTSSTLQPWVRVFNAGGQKVCEAYTYGATAEIGTCTLTSAGLYTIIADDNGMNKIGNFTLTLTCLNVGCGSAGTPMPTSTPMGNCCAVFTALGILCGGNNLNMLSQTADLIDVYTRFRDETLQSSPTGQRYIGLYNENTHELAGILLVNSELRSRTAQFLDHASDEFASLLPDATTTRTLDQNLYDEANVLVHDLAAAGSPELRDEMLQVWAETSLDQHVGETTTDIWAEVQRLYIYLPVIIK